MGQAHGIPRVKTFLHDAPIERQIDAILKNQPITKEHLSTAGLSEPVSRLELLIAMSAKIKCPEPTRLSLKDFTDEKAIIDDIVAILENQPVDDNELPLVESLRSRVKQIKRDTPLKNEVLEVLQTCPQDSTTESIDSALAQSEGFILACKLEGLQLQSAPKKPRP